MGNGTIYDTELKLIWCKNGNIVPEYMNWKSAQQVIARLNSSAYLGFRDWRLPTKKELESLRDYGIKAGYGSDSNPTANYLNMQGFVNVQIKDYWSVNNDNDVWFVFLNNKSPEKAGKDANGTAYVWPVRSGQ